MQTASSLSFALFCDIRAMSSAGARASEERKIVSSRTRATRGSPLEYRAIFTFVGTNFRAKERLLAF